MSRATPVRVSLVLATIAIVLTPGLSADTAAHAKDEPPLVVFQPPSPEELAAVALPDLRLELLRLAADDQQARLVGGCGDPDADVASAAANVAAVDRTNTKRLKAIVAEYGWPTVAMVGSDGARAAWLLVQHADHDLEWQRHCLALMVTHAESEQADPIDVAYLTDRVHVNEGRPQVYGTQFHWVDGKRHPRPIGDPDRVDERRQKLSMRSLKAYSKFVNT